jgi:hypothetical protein
MIEAELNEQELKQHKETLSKAGGRMKDTKETIGEA